MSKLETVPKFNVSSKKRQVKVYRRILKMMKTVVFKYYMNEHRVSACQVHVRFSVLKRECCKYDLH